MMTCDGNTADSPWPKPYGTWGAAGNIIRFAELKALAAQARG